MRNEVSRLGTPTENEAATESPGSGVTPPSASPPMLPPERRWLEKFASGAAHAINNPLAIVLFNLSLIRESLERPASLTGEREELQAMVGDAIEGAKRISDIVKDLSLMMRPPAGVSDRQCPNTAVLRALMAGPDYLQHVTYHLGATGQVRAPAGALEQAFAEILRNAHQAVQSPSEITVATRDEGDRVIVTVHDQGCGIAQADLPHVFEPFFQSKATGAGAGLGLTAAQHLIAAAGGAIEIESAAEVGTTVRITLPVDGTSLARRHS